MLKRAYSVLNVKEIAQEGDFYVIKGIATTPSTDRMGDIVEPLGATFAPKIPLLWQHQADKPVGHAEFGKPTKNGIPFTAKLPIIKEAGVLKDRVDEAIQSIKYRLVAAVSIGFRVINDAIERIDTGLRFLETEIMELSLVTIPANAEANITNIKSIDQKLLAASGKSQSRVVRLESSPGVTGKSSHTTLNKKDKTMNIAEQIKQFESSRSSKEARMTEIMEGAANEGKTLDAEQTEEYDTLAEEVKSIDSHLKRLDVLQKAQVAKAKAVEADEVNGKDGSKKAANTRSGLSIHISKDADEKFQGQSYTRMVIAKTLAHIMGGGIRPSEIALSRWGKTNPLLVEVIRANEVAGLASGSGEPGAELVSADNRFTGDFIEYLNSRTVFDKLPFREVPPNVAIKGQDGAATGYWIGESKAIKMSKPDFSSVSLTPLKVAAITTISNELLRDSSPAAEALVRDALVEAAAQRVDATVFSTDAASAGVSPAGLLQGLSPGSSAGVDGDDLRADVKALYSGFITAKNASGLYFVMNPSLAKAIQLMTNALGQQEFAGITQNGGTLLGDPVVTGENINANHLILLKPSDIYKIGDGGVEVSVSTQATIEQSTAPTGAQDTPTAQSQAMVNMFQNESTAIKVVRRINFAKRRSTAVSFVDDADYGSVAS